MNPENEVLRVEILRQLQDGPKTTRAIALRKGQLYDAKARRGIQEMLRSLRKSGLVEVLSVDKQTQELVYGHSPFNYGSIEQTVIALEAMRKAGRPKEFKDSEVVSLREHGLSAVEIAKLMGISTESVYAALRKMAPHLLKLPKSPKEVCKWGHKMTEENTLKSSDGFRRCRACWSAAQKRHQSKRRTHV